jgi:2-(3-amino-3-carboxypropyl)histidine synthase
MNYELELGAVAEKIRKEKAKIVCIQLPEGLRPKAKQIADELEQKTGAEIIIWQGSCFGACDLPIGLEKLGVDLLVQWGHSEWKH